MAERFGDTETIARAYNYMGCAMLILDAKRGHELMERSLSIGREANLPFAIAGTLANISQMLVEIYQLADAERYLVEGIAYATDNDDHYHLQNMLMWQALIHLCKGQYVEANDILTKNLQSRNIEELIVHTYALLARGRIQIRQGESNTLDIFDEALALSIQADTIGSMGPVRAARAEVAWLLGDNERTIEEARAVYEIAVSKKHPWIAGELAFWRWRAGDEFDPPAWIGKPFALQISGDWHGAAQEWEQRGYPYEQALALMDGDEKAQLVALEIFERLNAHPLLEKLKQKMRMMGIRGIPRGPRPATRKNPFGLTSREMEVLAYLVEGSSNTVIATKLSLSTRTVEHHITSILQKMDVQSRIEAASLAIKINILSPP